MLGWGAEDASFEIREAIAKDQRDSSEVVRVRDGARDAWRDLVRFPYGEDGGMLSFSEDCKTVLATSSLGRDTTALVRLDARTGAELEVIAAHAKCDCGGVILDDDTKAVRAVGFNYARVERVFFDEQARVPDVFFFLSRWFLPSPPRGDSSLMWLASCTTPRSSAPTSPRSRPPARPGPR